MNPLLKKTLHILANEAIASAPVLVYIGFVLISNDISFKVFIIFNSTFLCIYTLIILLSSKIKRPITLTEEERNLSPDMYPDYSSSIDWLSVIIWAVSSFLTGIILFSHRGLIVAIVMASLTSLAIMVIFYLFSSRNKYTIQENILHIQEYEWSHLTTDLYIPIDNIEKVYISDFLITTPSVVIIVNGIERKLRCTSYSEELAHAIAIRIKQQ